MASTNPGPFAVLVRRLQQACALDDAEAEHLTSLPITVKKVERNETISREGDHPKACVLVVDGFLNRFMDTFDGRRQILSFYVPGDVPDLQTLHLNTMDHSLAALTPAKLAFIPHEPLAALCEQRPKLGAALWRETLIDASVARTWIKCIGRLPADARVAHVLCELFVRLQAVGLVDDHPVRMPLTQQAFADALGLSIVQVNRSLRDLRLAGLVTVQRREMIVHDWCRLQEVAQFDPKYLHLQKSRPSPIGLN